MRALVNALSVTNLSARTVLLGHLARLAGWTRGEHDFVVLYHAANRDLCRQLAPNVRWVECPSRTAGWWARSLWERSGLRRMIREHSADLLVMMSGTVAGGIPVPQITLAMNPWCFVRRAQRGPGQLLKAFLQRWAYRKTVRRAAMIVYLSEYLRRTYRSNAGRAENASEIAYAPLSDDVLPAAAAHSSVARRKNRILCVSGMLPHKGVETILEALLLLRREHGIEAELVLVGSWPDGRYEAAIRRLVEESRLESQVHFEGHVNRETLLRHYGQAQVFCLMSWCESFGIPAVEAQAFGTPVVSSNCCAIPEVCGGGGIYPNPGDAQGTCEALAALLDHEDLWREFSEAAAANAAKYGREECTRPLMRMFDLVRTSDTP